MSAVLLEEHNVFRQALAHLLSRDPDIEMVAQVNTALEAIDCIKDTASSHQRAHVVQVMGRDCGYLALMSAIAGGAEAVLVPEFEPRPEEIMRAFESSWEQGKPHFLVVAAEGAPLSAEDIHEYINGTKGTFESRLTVLGHVQRGGPPARSTGCWRAAWAWPRSKRSPKESPE